MCTFLFWMLHCGIWNRCILRFVKQSLNWPNSQIPEWTCSISHNAPFRTEMCTFLFWMLHCGIWNRCILRFVNKVNSYDDCELVDNLQMNGVCNSGGYCWDFYTNTQSSLTHYDTIWQHKSRSTFAQVMTCCLTPPSHYLKQMLTNHQ